MYRCADAHELRSETEVLGFIQFISTLPAWDLIETFNHLSYYDINPTTFFMLLTLEAIACSCLNLILNYLLVPIFLYKESSTVGTTYQMRLSPPTLLDNSRQIKLDRDWES